MTIKSTRPPARRHCPQCQSPLTAVGPFLICPEHGQARWRSRPRRCASSSVTDTTPTRNWFRTSRLTRKSVGTTSGSTRARSGLGTTGGVRLPTALPKQYIETENRRPSDEPVSVSIILPRWFLNQRLTDSLIAHGNFYLWKCSARGAKFCLSTYLPARWLTARPFSLAYSFQ